MVVNRERRLFDIAEDQLDGVGDVTLGEWREVGDTAVHLRRRLTDDEAAYAAIASVIDVRGTEEFTHRIQRIRPFLPLGLRTMPDEAFP
jgi:hypothetical protein